MLKLGMIAPTRSGKGPAAFGRLCVETGGRSSGGGSAATQPPSGGCVLKPLSTH